MNARRTFSRAAAVQQGAALITALLLVAIASIVATGMYYDSFLYIKRSGNLLLSDQARLYALGAEDWAIDTLRRDTIDNPDRDHLAEEWAAVLPPLPIDGGSLQGGVEDQQGRFNLNNLIDVNGELNQTALEQFQRLLEAVGLELQLAGRVVDWLDANQEPMFPDGAEDPVYTGLQQPYRTANGPITSSTELLAIEGFNRERYQAISAYVTALPSGTTVNVNTASAPVLYAVVPGITAAEAEGLVDSRPEDGFASMTEFSNLAPSADLAELSLTSQYFRLLVRVTIGTLQSNLYSLIVRDPAAVRPILRNYGSE